MSVGDVCFLEISISMFLMLSLTSENKQTILTIFNKPLHSDIGYELN